MYTSHDRIPKLMKTTPPDEHVWVIAGAWMVTVEAIESGTLVMNEDNMLTSSPGPGCFKCEESYSPQLAAQPCRGSWE